MRGVALAGANVSGCTIKTPRPLFAAAHLCVVPPKIHPASACSHVVG